MFARKGPAASPQTLAPGAPPEIIFDVTVADFETRVLMASMERPVIVDFWSPRSAVCKTLVPALEAAARDAGGKILLAKINSDKEQQLVQALRVQTVPTVFAFFQGQPVNAFAGGKTAAEIKAFVQQLVQLVANGQPEAIDIPAALKLAAENLASGDIGGARELFTAILLQEEKNIPAHVGIVRSYIAEGAPDAAESFIASMPDDIAKHPDFAAARTALDLARNAPAGDLATLQAKAEANPSDPAPAFDYSLALFAAGRRAEAIEAMVEIVRRHRAWEDDKARLQCLSYFEAMGPADPETLAGRRRLSAVLFS